MDSGATVLVARDGKIVYYKGLGYDDIDKKTPMKKDAICRIASQTKAITSVAVMMLYEEGKILLNDPVSKYIPEFKNPKVLDKSTRLIQLTQLSLLKERSPFATCLPIHRVLTMHK